MFKLILLSVLVAAAVAKPAESPLLAALVSEKTIESHGNTVVHASAPVAAPAPALLASPVIAEPAIIAHAAPAPIVAEPVAAAPIAIKAAPEARAATASIVQEKTIESHGNSIVHASAPLLAAHPVPLLAPHSAPILAVPQTQPVIYTAFAAPATALIGEKTVTSYGHSIVHGAPAIAHPAYIAPTLAFF